MKNFVLFLNIVLVVAFAILAIIEFLKFNFTVAWWLSLCGILLIVIALYDYSNKDITNIS